MYVVYIWMYVWETVFGDGMVGIGITVRVCKILSMENRLVRGLWGFNNNAPRM